MSGAERTAVIADDHPLMRDAVRRVLEGGKLVTPDIVTLLDERPAGPALSPRERQTLSLVTQRLSNAEIGAGLNISPKTVDKHHTRLMAKLAVHSMSELLAYVLREDLLDVWAAN